MIMSQQLVRSSIEMGAGATWDLMRLELRARCSKNFSTWKIQLTCTLHFENIGQIGHEEGGRRRNRLHSFHFLSHSWRC